MNTLFMDLDSSGKGRHNVEGHTLIRLTLTEYRGPIIIGHYDLSPEYTHIFFTRLLLSLQQCERAYALNATWLKQMLIKTARRFNFSRTSSIICEFQKIYCMTKLATPVLKIKSKLCFEIYREPTLEQIYEHLFGSLKSFNGSTQRTVALAAITNELLRRKLIST